MSALVLGQHQLGYELADLFDDDGLEYIRLIDIEQLNSIDCGQDVIVYPDLLYVAQRGKAEAADFHKLLKVCDFARQNKAPLLCITGSEIFSTERSKTYAETSDIDGDSDLAAAYLEFESTIERVVSKPIILRTAGLFSTSTDGFLAHLLKLIEENDVLEVPRVSKCLFTASRDLARVICAMVKQLDCGVSEWGVYHYCGSEQVSYQYFADTVLATANQYASVKSVQVVEVARESVGQLANSVSPKISCQKIRNTFGVQQRPWRKFLEQSIKELCQ